MTKIAIRGTGLVEGQVLTGRVDDKQHKTTITSQDISNGYIVWPPREDTKTNTAAETSTQSLGDKNIP